MNLILEISVVAIVIGVVVNRATRNYLYSNECTINDYLLPNGYYYKLIDGTEFDSSVKRGVPAQFGVTQVIAGWTEALQLMEEGSKWELYIPADLAYGPGGTGPIGPNATLIFEVELLQANVASGEG